jgi:hypothetical protein
MARKTIYCAQAFWRRDGRLTGGVVHQFHTEERARAGGEILAGSADGVAVFRLTGEADVDFWDEPVLIVTFGATPGHGDEADAA